MIQNNMTIKEKEVIERNLIAYLTHFKPITIEKRKGFGFFVFQEGNPDYIQRCENIHYLNGWLYGAVQMYCKVIQPK